MIFFFSECGGKPQDRDEGLDFAGAMGETTIFCRDTHRSTDEGAVVIEATAAICFQGRAGAIVKICDEPVDLLIGPSIEKDALGQLWEGSLHGGSLPGGTLDNSLPVIRWQLVQSLLKGLDVEERDRKRADAATGAADPAGNLIEQGGRCPLKPVIGFPI